MAIVQLQGELREKRGKGPARESRRQGKIPAVIYGKGEQSLAINVNLKELVTVMHGHAGSNVIIDLKLAGGEASDTRAIIRDLQRDPITGQITHLDLQHISMSQEITVEVPVHTNGIATGVKDFGGILEFVMRSVPVKCMPTDIPDAIEIDISRLGIHESIHVRDIQLANARIDVDPTMVIVTVVPPTIEKAASTPEELAAAAAAAAAEPEVIGKKKEEGEEGAAAGETKPEKKEEKKKEKK